jgi:hypothetical protein
VVERVGELVAVEPGDHDGRDGEKPRHDPETAVSPKAAPAGPAIAMETGIRTSETKKSRLETRPRKPSGTRRWSRVPQITIAAE